MASLSTLRNKGGILLAVVIGIALIAFVLGDLLTSGSTLMNSSQMNVGTINGEKVSTMEYSQLIDELTEVQRITTGQAGSTEEMTEQIRAQAWDKMIRDKAFKPAAAEAGLKVSEDEMVSLLSGEHLSPIMAQMFADPQTGMFSPEYLRYFLSQVNDDETGGMQLFWNHIQTEVADQSLLYKFKSLVDKAAYVTSLEAKQMAATMGNAYDVKFIVERFEAVPDSSLNITESDLKKYYDSHKNMFRQDDTRSIEYVTFEALPSPADYAAAEEAVKKLAEDLKTAPNVQQFVSFNSHNQFDARYYNAGELSGELGTFAFSAKPDEIYGPVQNGDQWTIARVADTQVMPDSIQLSTIVLAPGQKALADSLLGAMKKPGANFAQAAMNYSEDPQSSSEGGDMGTMDPQTLIPQLSEALKGAKKGDILSVDNLGGGYIYILKVNEVKGESRKVQLGVLNYNIEPSEATRNETYGEANRFATLVNSQGFEKASAENALAKRVATVGPNDRTVGGIQQSRELARWAFNGKVGEISNVMEFGNSFVIANLTASRERGIAPYEQVKDNLRQLVAAEKKGTLLADQLKSVTSLAGREGTIEASGLTFQSFMAPEVGYDPAFPGGLAGIQNAAAGVVSKPIIGRIGVYVAEVTNVTNTPVDEEIEKARLTAEGQQSAFMEAYQAFITMSDVSDTRYKFY